MPAIGFALAAPLLHTDLVKFVQGCEGAGLDSFWFTEGTRKEAFSQLGAVAVQTRSIKLGTAIVNIFSRSPTVLATTAATMDDISGGRFILGLGSGHRAALENHHGVAFGKPIERMRDYVAIIRSAVTGEPVTHEGAAHKVRSLRLGFPAPSKGVPIYVAVLRLKMAQLAGEVADGVILHLATLGHVSQVKEAIARGARAAGRDPSAVKVACFIMCSASSDISIARGEVTRSVAYYGSMPYYRNLFAASGFRAEAEGFERAWAAGDAQTASGRVTPRMLESLSVSAGPAETREKAEAFRKAGVDLPILYPVFPSADPVKTVWDALRAVTS